MTNKYKLYKVLIFLPFVLIFMITYFRFIYIIYIIPNEFEAPLFIFIGFGIIIFVSFYFFTNLNSFNSNKNSFLKLKIPNETSLKIVIFLLMLLSILIPRVSFSDIIIDWANINPLNYGRAIIFLIGASFLPGSIICKYFLPVDSIALKLNVEPFLIKLTLYPLISFIFLGLITYILDSIGLIRDFFVISLIIFISILLLFDILNQKVGTKAKIFNLTELRVSKNSFLILVLCSAIIIIACSIQMSSLYLIPGDNYRGIKYSYYIGQLSADQFTKFYGGYSMYWGYISFSLSILCGIPVINTNALLFPFLYLFVTSIYIFLKALLNNFKNSYITLATILIITFSGLFSLFNDNIAIHSKLLVVGIFQFSFHSFAFFCLFTSLSLFILLSRHSFKKKRKIIFKKEIISIIFIGALLLLHSYLIYFLPFIGGFSFILIYSLFSKDKIRSFNYFLKLWKFWVILFIFYDLFSTFYFSLIPINYAYYFFGTPQPQISNPITLFYNGLMVYSVLGISYLFFYLIYKILIKYYSNKYKKYKKKKTNLFIILIGSLIIFLEIQIVFNLYLNFNQNFFLFYLDLIFLNFGIIGILGLILSYFLYDMNRKLFIILMLWLFFLFFTASILIFRNWSIFPQYSPIQIPSNDYFFMMYWFTRNWYLSIIPLSIFCAFGLIGLINYVKNRRSLNKLNDQFKLILNLFLISILIICSLTSTINSGIYWSDKGDGNRNKPYYINDEEANIMGWVSKNIPSESNILIDRYLLYHLIDIAFCPTYYIWDELKKAEENYNGWYSEDKTYPNCNLELTEDLDGKNKILRFYDDSPDGSAIVKIHLNSNFTMGSIEFYSRYSDESKHTYLVVKNDDGHIGLHIGTNDEGFGYYNGTDWNYIYAYQSNIWYRHKINFYCNESSIGVFEWYINGTLISDNCIFQSNSKFLNYIELGTGWTETGGFYFWIDSFNITTPLILENLEEEILTINSNILINHLKSENIKYFIVNRWNLLTYDILIEKYFNQSLYQYGNLLIFKSV